MKRVCAWAFALAFAAILLVSAASQAQLLQQPIRIVFPFAAGGGGDALARLLAEELRTALNRNVVVENKTGAGGQAGTLEVVNAVPNGDTILLTPIAPVVLHQNIYKNLRYDPIKDLKPVALISDFEFAIAVGPAVPAKTLQELIAWMKANPNKASYGTPGAGALPHFFGVLFAKAVGVEMVHIGYRGSALALVDLISGQIPIVVTTTSDLLQNHKEGKIRILATSDNKRSPLVPEVPTFKELGYNIEGTSWYGVFAPAKTPDDIVNKYSKILSDALRTAAMKEKLLKLGLYARGSTPDELGKLQKDHADFWKPAIEASGFKPEN
jgi:tripartite-type tricarboxylate transporter receptor subunit TctC